MVLARVVTCGFIALGGITMAGYLRHRGRDRAFLAAAFCLLGVTSVIGQVQYLFAQPNWLLADISLTAFLASGAALLGFRSCFLPLSRGAGRLSMAGLLGAALVGYVSVAFGASRYALGMAAAVAVIGGWSACVAEPAVRFWIASRSRPAVQRKRLRSMAAGYLGIVFVLAMVIAASSVAALESTTFPPAFLVVYQLSVLATLPLLAAGFAPPRWLRHMWRRGEEQAFRSATEDLLRFSSDRGLLGKRALAGAIQLFGADAGVLMRTDGQVLAAQGLDAGAALEMAAQPWVRNAKGRVHLLGRPVARMAVPVISGNDRLWLVLVAGPFTPLFGIDEVRTIEAFAAFIGTAMDRVDLVERLAVETTHNQSLLDALSDMGEGVHITEAGRVTFANEAFARLTGYSIAELVAMDSMIALAPEDLREELVARGIQRAAGADVPFHYETQLMTKDGSRADIEVVVKSLGRPEQRRMMTIVRDIAERKAAERAVADLVRVDPLTRVLNRRGWSEALDEGLARARRSGEPLSVAVLDLDSFKAFNDDWGHQRGDFLLQSVAEAWRSELREVDVIARYGGDEFTVMLPGSDVAGAQDAVQRLRALTPDQKVSIGLATWNRQETAESLVGRADTALFRAKREGGGSTMLASAVSEGDAFTNWSRRLEDLISERDLAAVYQPIVALDTRVPFGYEALARPAGAGASASVEDLFVAAQRLGFGRDMDWLGRRAAVHGAHDLPPGSLLFINVGVSALLDPVHDVDQMLLLLKWAGRDPSEVVLEISEREAITDLDRLREVLAEYRAEGFRFALDDIGDGHCTLEVLSAAGAEFIKIARSLTSHCDEPGPLSAIHAVSTFASFSGAQVIAEGIDSEEMLEVLRDLGITLGQGFYLGRPAVLGTEVAVAPPAAAGGIA
ncbi:MAG: hypothetical protein QOE92_313 [Chloroflexota bacterium]|nr:hypothetical protein [Chloroflexota bacterium]